MPSSRGWAHWVKPKFYQKRICISRYEACPLTCTCNITIIWYLIGNGNAFLSFAFVSRLRSVIIYIRYNFTRIYFIFFQWILIRYIRSCSRYSSKANVRLGLGETWPHSGCILYRSEGILTVLVHQGACLTCVNFTFHAFYPPQNGLCALSCKWNSTTFEMTILFLFFLFLMNL